MKYIIAKVIQTCDACPSQWSARADDGTPIYIRYRWGRVRVEAADEIIYSQDIGGEFDGHLTDDEMITHTAPVLDFARAEWVDDRREVEAD